MPDLTHLSVLQQGVDVWNRWREANPQIVPDLREADLSRQDFPGVVFAHCDMRGINLRKSTLVGANLDGADLTGGDLSHSQLQNTKLNEARLAGARLRYAILTNTYFVKADLKGADLTGSILTNAVLAGADLEEANLSGARLVKADLMGANLVQANLESANLEEAILIGAKLHWARFVRAGLIGADLRHSKSFAAQFMGADLRDARLNDAMLQNADLTGANLESAVLVNTDLTGAVLHGCRVHGIAAWALCLDDAAQSELVITTDNEQTITVDDLEVAQFLYLLLNNKKVQAFVEKVTSSVVLILGRFTDERKPTLDALRAELRRSRSRYVPVIFDFAKPRTATTLETVTLLAKMARFVIADLTDAKSVLMELQAIVPNNPSVPVRPLLLASQQEPGMLDSFKRYDWFLPVYTYQSEAELVARVGDVVAPAEALALRIRGGSQEASAV